MAYTVLARKYRSQTFDDVIGQDPIARTLKNAIKTGKVAHAYLFTGTRGIGKTTMARVLAKSLNCLAVDAPTAEPCCKCDSCIAINIGDDIDVIEIDGASNNSVDEVRKLRENAIYRPARARYKIYIIDEVHMLSTSAFNALLKILEEPPSHVKFIFATTEPNKVIATIQSRCQRFDFNSISAAKIAEQLKFVLGQEKIQYEEDLILPLAKMANGSMRDALSLLDRLISTGEEPLTANLLEEFLGQPNSEKIYNLIDQIGDSNAAGTLTAIQDLISTGLSEVQIADALVDYMRDMMVIKAAPGESEILALTAEQQKRAGQLAEKFDTAALIYSITALERLRWTLKNSDTPRALLEATLLRFALAQHFLNVDELMSQIKGGSTTTVKKKEPPRASSETSSKSQIAAQQIAIGGPQMTNPEPPSDFVPHDESQAKPTRSAPQDAFRRRQPKISSQKKNEIVSDPAVKMVLVGLNATVTGIEEDSGN
jgi:DNA polymerase-3 subunit gamma/tau